MNCAQHTDDGSGSLLPHLWQGALRGVQARGAGNDLLRTLPGGADSSGRGRELCHGAGMPARAMCRRAALKMPVPDWRCFSDLFRAWERFITASF